jgi:hypothetical protein
MLLCCWAKGHKEPLHLLTNLASALTFRTPSTCDHVHFFG